MSPTCENRPLLDQTLRLHCCDQAIKVRHAATRYCLWTVPVVLCDSTGDSCKHGTANRKHGGA